MSTLNNRFLFSLIILILLPLCTNAQGSSSPYSAIGIGDIRLKGNIRNIGMGGLGISNGSPLSSNLANPALLVHNKLTLFEAGFGGEYKKLSSFSNDKTGTSAGANLEYFLLTFPIVKWWTTSVGLRPVSSVNYSIEFQNKIPNRPMFVDYKYTGEGGLTQIYFSNGFYIYKGLSLGLEVDYNFGLIKKESSTGLVDGTAGTDLKTVLIERRNYQHVSIMPGLLYTLDLSDKHKINFGAVYEPKGTINSKLFKAMKYNLSSDAPVYADTILLNAKTSGTLPEGSSFGISFEKQFYYTFGIDIQQKKWSQYQDERINQNDLKNTFSVRIGAEVTPNPTSISNYMARVTYRAGVYQQYLPWVVDGYRLKEVGINFGFTLPMRNFSGLSMAFGISKREAQQEVLIKETTYSMQLGLTVNDRWFVRRKFN